MPHILLILPATTYRAQAFLEAANKLDIAVTIGCDQRGPWNQKPADGLVLLDFKDFSESEHRIKTFAKTYPLDGIIGVEDTTAFLAASLSSALGLPHNSPRSASTARNKFHMRTLLGNEGMSIPHFSLCSIDEDPQQIAPGIQFPCVIKPLTLSASCGVIRANDMKSFSEAFLRIKTLLIHMGLTEKDEGQHLLVEDFIPGFEVAVEGLMINGALTILALFDKPDPLDGPFFEETLYVTPSRHSKATQDSISETMQQAARALGLREGPIHGEVRVNETGTWIIEVAARSIGGRCSQTLRFGSGISLEELILRHSLRMELPDLKRENQAAGVMMLPIKQLGRLESIHGQHEAKCIPGIESLEMTAQPGDLLVPLPEGTRYLGFLLARAASPDRVESALRKAYDCLHIHITPIPNQPDEFGVIRV